MRIALLPLDSRPPNWQFPQRLADIAGVELLLPPREWLGSLHDSAQQPELLDWLAHAAGECDAAVFSYDTLVYGGLIQSRRDDLPLLAPQEIFQRLGSVDWQRCAGYALGTVARLGLSVTDRASLGRHQLVREYLIAHARAQTDSRAATAASRLEAELTPGVVQAVWNWRARNAAVSADLLRGSCELGLRRLHFAVEDNAPAGPHLVEAAVLRQQAMLLRQDHPATITTLFDGTDEALCLLLARAILDLRQTGRMRVQLLLHPRAPGPEQYTGLYESQPLGSGLDFLASFLGFEYAEQADRRWLVCFGKQPQPDLFTSDPQRVFNSPFLLPKGIDPGGPLLLSDLCACNGANPNLALQVAQLTALQQASLLGLCGFNTNFNTLGVSAAWISLLRLEEQDSLRASRRFALERLADDLVYQSVARPRLLAYLQQRGSSAFDFSKTHPAIHDEAARLVGRYWREWCSGPGASVLASCGIEEELAHRLRFSFPWQRAFECEAEAPTL